MTSVDVVIPCYNYAHYLAGCVDSVLSQDGVDVRALIIDDCSTDNTPDICRQLAADPRVRYIRHAVNKGHIATYNEGLEQATADYVLLLSADDLLVPGCLSRATALMNSAPHVGFTFGNCLNLNRDGSLERSCPLGENSRESATRVFSGPEFIRLSGARNIVPTPTALVRTSLQHKVGGYRPELPHSGDMEMWLRLASHADVGFVNDDQGTYRLHNANMSLGYLVEKALPDLRQRKRALEILFSGAGPNLNGNTALQNFLVRDLAQRAAQQAAVAFNASDLAATEAIKRFAVDVSPGVRRSWLWARLLLKQAIGPANWRALNVIRREPGRRS